MLSLFSCANALIIWIVMFTVAAAAECGHEHADGMSYVDMIRNKLKSMMDSNWPSIANDYFVGHNQRGNTNAMLATRPVNDGTTSSSPRGLLANGFFYRPSVERPASTLGPVTIRPMDARGTDKTTVNAHDDAVVIAPVTIRPVPTVFGTERECEAAVSAARGGGGRWLCVCYTPDYLDWVGQQLDEMTAAMVDEALSDGSFQCPYFKAVAAILLVRPEDARPNDDVDVMDGQPSTDVVATTPNTTADNGDGFSARTSVDLDLVAEYRLERSGDHFFIHYGLVGSDIHIRCLENPGKNLIKWHYPKSELKTKSTIINTDSNELAIMGMEAADSKNYTCLSNTVVIEKAKNVKIESSYTHYIIAIEKANYEIRGTATYNANGNDICTHEIIELVQKQLSALLRTEVCPEGSTRYACNIDILTASCAENKKTLVIEYSMTLNDMANIFTRIRTSKKGQNALYHQQIVARISSVLASNLKKTLSTAQIVSKFTFAETRFEPDHDHMKINTFVSCTPGFGLREVFCAACPLHHYSPDRATKCLKCPKGFHQPIAGSVKCVKCPTPFASGCYMDEVLASNNYIVISASITFLFLFVLVGLLFCCCRKQNENKCLHNIRTIPGSVRRRFKLFKEKELLPKFNNKKVIVSKGIKVGKSLMRLVKKPKQKHMKPTVPFEVIHAKMAPNHHTVVDIGNS